MRGKFYKRTDISAVKRLFLGAGMAMAALLLFSAIFSGISMLTDDAAAKIPLFAILTLVVSAAVGGAVSTRTVSDGRLSLSLLSALLAALHKALALQPGHQSQHRGARPLLVPQSILQPGAGQRFVRRPQRLHDLQLRIRQPLYSLSHAVHRLYPLQL